MSSIMIDAFTMDVSLDSVATVGKGILNPIQEKSFHNLLTGILLWDKLEYPSDSYVDSKFKMLDGDSLTKQLRSIVTSFDAPLFKPYGPDYNEWRSAGSLPEVLEDKIKTGLIQRTQMYLDISSDKQLPYLPCPERSNHFIENEHSIHTREALIKRLEDKINEYSSSSAILFNTPILIDYIKSQVGDAPREQLLCALQLRMEKDVVEFRTSLNKLEQLCAPGTVNYKTIGNNEIDEISKEVFRKYSPNKNNTNLSFSIKASFGMLGGLSPEVGININNISIPRRRIINKKFLYKLLRFGLNERR